MKRQLGAFLLTIILVLSLFPHLTTAAQNSKFELELSEYLNEVSNTRGFKVTKADIEISLSYYGDSLRNYQSAADLKGFLGEVIESDYSNLTDLYDEFNLDHEEMVSLLEENGESLEDYIFIDDLSQTIYFYTEDFEFERDPDFDQNFAVYLAEVSAERGFEVTKEDIETALKIYDESIANFESVKQLEDFLGEVIKADLSNLVYFKENYDLDQQSLLQLLAENDKDLHDYIYIFELEETVWTLMGLEEEIAEDLLPIFEDELGLTEKELQNIEEHLISLEDHLSDQATIERLDVLGNRMLAIGEFEVTEDLSAGQIAELASIYDEILSIFKLKASYSLVKDGSETPLSLADLIRLDELKGANLKVTLFSVDGTFLADLIITGEMVSSEVLEETGKQVEESAMQAAKTIDTSVQPVKKHITKPMNHAEQKTVKGAKLPKTAGNYLTYAAIGVILSAAGSFLYRKVRNV
ncbi:processed acidic surface protein [Bacillus sp. CMF21]|nr:processed acidic surface protein [Bacillus sp. CMF21]